MDVLTSLYTLYKQNRRSWMLDDPRHSQSELMLGSESGGNDSDNSLEEPRGSSSVLSGIGVLVGSNTTDNSGSSGGGSTIGASTIASGTASNTAVGLLGHNSSSSSSVGGGGGPLPPMMQRNAHHRQSLQRRPHEQSPLMRTGARNSYQSLRRDDSTRSHRNSLHRFV